MTLRYLLCIVALAHCVHSAIDYIEAKYPLRVRVPLPNTGCSQCRVG